METPFATAHRLLAALEELVAEETILLRAGDFAEAAQIRARTSAIVEKLCALANAPQVDTLRPRLVTLLQHSQENADLLERELGNARLELEKCGHAQGRLRNVVPAYQAAYGRPGRPTGRLDTAA